MNLNRKIGKHAANDIANRFVCSHDFQAKLNDLKCAMEERSDALDQVVQEFAENSQAKQWFDTLSEEDQSLNEIGRAHV